MNVVMKVTGVEFSINYTKLTTLSTKALHGVEQNQLSQKIGLSGIEPRPLDRGSNALLTKLSPLTLSVWIIKALKSHTLLILEMIKV